MNEKVALQPAVLLHAQLESHPAVQEAINRFLETPLSPSELQLYTAARRVIPRSEYHTPLYGSEVATVSRAVKKLSQAVLNLTAPLKIQQQENGDVRLFFTVENQAVLEEISKKVRRLQTHEETPSEGNLLYATLPARALAKDIGRRNAVFVEANRQFKEDCASPVKRHELKATGAKLVEKQTAMPLPLVADAS